MKSMSQICIFTSNFTSERLGKAKYSTDLAETLAGAGYEVSVLAGMAYYPWRTKFSDSLEMEDKSFELIRIRHFKNYKNLKLGRLLFELTFAFQLTREIFLNFSKTKLILAVSLAVGSPFATIILNKIRRIDYILILQDLMHIGIRESGFSKSRLFSAIAFYLEKYSIRRASKVIIVSDQMKNMVKD